MFKRFLESRFFHIKIDEKIFNKRLNNIFINKPILYDQIDNCDYYITIGPLDNKKNYYNYILYDNKGEIQKMKVGKYDNYEDENDKEIIKNIIDDLKKFI